MSTIVYDIEIIKAIPDRSSIPNPDIEYCEGWNDHANMGISVIGAYDYEESRYRVFCSDNINDFFNLLRERTIAVTFNGISFDNNVIKAAYPDHLVYDTPTHVIDKLEQYDILVETWKAHGLDSKFNYKTHGGFSLDAISKVNLNNSKTGNGALAPVLWQKGQIGSVIDYCLQDVRLTKLLFDRIIHSGKLISPRTSRLVTLRNPYDNHSV